MFGIGETELLIIVAFGFMIFGPDKLPGMGRTIGRALRQFRQAQEGFTEVVQTEEYTVVDDKDRMRQIRDVAYAAMEESAARKRYTSSFDDFYYAKMKQSEATVRKGDLLFCGAPHLFVAHVKATGRWAADYAINCNLATAYFELLANAHGLGTVIMSYPSDVLCELAPEAREMLGIPADHYMKLIVGFGYPEIPYARGVQKNRRKVHR